MVATLHGTAVRDAAPASPPAPLPLVILSHGYPGNRYLMSHLGEHLASRGFVVVSIDHRDSTYDDQKSFASTLYNRPLDQLFVLAEIDRLGGADSRSFLRGLVDASRTGVVGYSMGGFGVVNVLGAGFSRASETFAGAPPNRLLAERGASNPDVATKVDARIKAAIAIAPWGAPSGYWEADALKAVTRPVLFVAGSLDDVSGYEKGTRAIFEAVVNADRYLLTFVNANHNAAAPIPAPAETSTYAPALKLFPFVHYADAVWDTTRMNNILAHFATAFLSLHLKGEGGMQAYLEVVPRASDARSSVDKDGMPTAGHTYWKGFKPKTAAGLLLEHLAAGQAGATVEPRAAPASATPAAAVAPASKATGGDEMDIRRIAVQFESAWAAQDAAKIGALWTGDGDMMHPDGTIERGPWEIARNRAATFAQRRYRSSRHPLRVTMIKFRGPDVAVVDGRWEMTQLLDESGRGNAPPLRGLLTWVVQRGPAGWRIAAWRYTLGGADPAR